MLTIFHQINALPVPLLRQVHVDLFFGVFFEVEKSVEKVVPKGPQMDPKCRPKSIKRVFWRGLERGPRNGTLSRTRKSEILPLFTTLQQGRRSQKRHIFGYHFETVWETKSLKTGFQNSIKKSAENRHPFYEILGPFWGSFSSKQSVVCRSKMSLTCGPIKMVILASSGHPKSIKFEVFF